MADPTQKTRDFVVRYDAGETLQKPQRREDGTVVIEAYATRAGVFPYRQPDGSVVNELRHPDDVFDPESMASLALRPFTDGHPYGNVAKVDGEDIPGLLDASSARTYSRGMVTEKVWRDGDKLACRVVILDAELAAAVLAGDKAETSCGYTARTVAESGTYQGIPYQRRQKRPWYNHLAAVEHGRAGPDVRARLDARDGAMVRNPTPTTPAVPPAPGVPTVKIPISGVTFEIPDQAAEALAVERQSRSDEAAKMKAKLDEATATAAKEKARADQADEEKGKLKAKLDAELDPKARAAAVSERARLERIARKALGAKAKLDGTDDELRARVVAGKSKTFKLDSEDAKNPVYVRARFDSVVEAHKLDEGAAPTFPPGGDGSEDEKKKEEDMPKDGKTDEGDEVTTDGTGGTGRTDADDPEAAYKKSLADAWKPKAAAK
jgi:hypothetical protein